MQSGRSALHWASSAGETECVKVLLKYGAQVDLPVRCGIMHRNGSRVEAFCLGKLGNWFNRWGGRCLTQSGRGWYRPHPFLHVQIFSYSTLLMLYYNHMCVAWNILCMWPRVNKKEEKRVWNALYTLCNMFSVSNVTCRHVYMTSPRS